ncbi:hypothetical protein CRE_31193 [Caenorhabditis remanei]|uniref:Uncharacterized protein n=1 Tax=Caenorhabditis remanei TaxID=31234 RepID=E3MLI4_CAERE|nr:hypothetical protein CRE_31193 [Caenorhabditis remanei]
MPVFLLIFAAAITARPFNNTEFDIEQEGTSDEVERVLIEDVPSNTTMESYEGTANKVERVLIGEEPSNITMESFKTTTPGYTEFQVKMAQGVMMGIGILFIIGAMMISGPGRMLRGQ